MTRVTRDGIAPSPVYVATFADGSVGRVTFYSPKGKPIDVARGRDGCAAVYSRPDSAHWSTTYKPRTITKGHVEWNGQIIHDDMSARPKAPIMPPSLKQVLVNARAALQGGDVRRALLLLESV
jgi:hypothetical protein